MDSSSLRKMIVICDNKPGSRMAYVGMFFVNIFICIGNSKPVYIVFVGPSRVVVLHC